MSILSATSLAAGAVIAGASLTPDLCRFARSPTQAAIGSAIALFARFSARSKRCGDPCADDRPA